MEMDTKTEEERLQAVRERFAADKFATGTVGIEITRADRGSAECRLIVGPQHLNARGTVQGGAIFTLADFTFAVAANGCSEQTDTISLQHDITYLAVAKGHELHARAECIKQGRHTGMYTVDVTDELGTHVAYMTVNGYVVG